MKNKKLVALLGSPRKDGVTAKMSEQLCAQLAKEGLDCKTIHKLSENLAPCTGCMVCRDKGKCVIQDGLAMIRNDLRSCNMVVLAAPVYSTNVPGPVKTLFDRLSAQ